MPIEIGHVEAIFRYPVKSMGGERLEVANLGWHGLEGDRRLAFRRIDDRSGFPWLSASKLPDLLLFAPHRREDGAPGDLPTHVRTPDGEEMPVFGEDLAAEVGRRYGAPVQMMQLKHGIFDEASISVIASDTVREIGRLAGRSPDVRRFRPNVVVRLLRSVPFQEDEWVGGVLSFGEGDDAPAIAVTMRDVRCSMVNLDPDSASSAPEVLKAVVRANQNNAGIYGTVTRIGRLAVGQAILLHAAPPGHPAFATGLLRNACRSRLIPIQNTYVRPAYDGRRRLAEHASHPHGMVGTVCFHHADRGRTGGRYNLDRRVRHRQGRLDPDAEVDGD